MTFSELFQHIIPPTQQDLITSIFDFIFVCSEIQNLRVLIKDKQVKGFDWRNMCLYSAWNIWTIFVIYPNASIYLANVINILYLLTQIVWLSLFAKYKLVEKNAF